MGKHTKEYHRIRIYGLLFTGTILLGLYSRSDGIAANSIFGKYGGDILWASMVYWAMAFIFIEKRVVVPLCATLLFSYSIELSQLAHLGWLQSLRATTVGALVLGQGFLWSDLVCYAVGGLLASVVDMLLFTRIKVAIEV